MTGDKEEESSMRFNDFKMAERFWLDTVDGPIEYLCVDIATRHILAIEITDKIRADRSWLNGPPYAVALTVFDAYDIAACTKKPRVEEAA